MAVLAGELRDDAVEGGSFRGPRGRVGDAKHHVLAPLAGIEIERGIQGATWPVVVQLRDDHVEPIAAGVADSRRDAELDEAFADVTDDAQARAKAVSLDRLEPHAPHRTADGLVPDAASLVDPR